MRELGKRVFVSIIFIPILILALYFGGIPLYLMFLFVSVMGSQEYIAMMRNAGIDISHYWILLNPVMFSAGVFFPGIHLSLIWLTLLITMSDAAIKWNRQTSVPRMFATFWGSIYTALMPAMIVMISWQLHVKKILLALILLIWIVDTVAYFVGMRFGKKRNITPISPKKSREGFIAGLLAPAVISFILYICGFRYFSAQELALLVVASGVFGQLGDLLESMLKRFCDVKDSSRLIPGHGGVLDRTDSILLAGSFLYAALAMLINL
jgi:phosphatidate cytidylyltransferase